MSLPPVFVLARPQMGENIGAAARAMANFGITDLRLVAPRDGWPNPSALAMSSGALDHITVSVFDTLTDALHDVHYAFATTARPRDMVKPVVTPRQAAEETAQRDGQRTAFVFGAERTGLENDEVSQCHAIITAPTSPDFSSLNLGQGVLMVAYELFMALQSDIPAPAPKQDNPPATQEEFDNLFHRLEQALDDGGFFREESLRPKVTRNLRSPLLRAGLTSQEIKTLHGALRALINPRT